MRFVRHGEFYDISVPVAEHYSAHGLWHHNSGKSRACIVKGLVLSSVFPGNRGIIGRFRGTDIEDSTKPLFFEVTPPSWIRAYNKKDNTVVLRNGSEIYFRHIHDPKAMTKTRRLGANLGWFDIDQAEEIELEHWNAFISRLRHPMARKRFGFGNLNPNGRDWNWKTFFRGVHPWGKDGKRDGQFYQAIRTGTNILGVAVNANENRVSNGGFVDDSFFDSLIAQYPPEWMERFVLCSFEDFAGKIYKDYRAGLDDDLLASVHNIEPFDIRTLYPNWQLVVGIDVGGDSPWAVVPEYVDEEGNTIVAPGLVQGKTLVVSQVARWIKENLPWQDPRTVFVIDWENKQVMLELAEHGIHARPANKAVLPGILRVGGYFHVQKGRPLPNWYKATQPAWMWDHFSTGGAPRTFVFKTAVEYRREHDEYVWDPNKRNEPLKTATKRFDTCDADRYVKMSLPEPSPRVHHDPNAHLRTIDPLSAREWDLYDKRVQQRMERAQGYQAAKEADVESTASPDERVGALTVYDWGGM